MTSHRVTHRVHGARTAAAAPGTTSHDAAGAQVTAYRSGAADQADDWNSTGS